MGSKIINRIPSDAVLLGAAATLLLIGVGIGWVVRGTPGPTQVEVVRTDEHPVTDALLEEMESLSAATSVGINRRDYQVALQKLTLAYQRFDRAGEPAVGADAKVALQEVYKDYLFAKEAWEWSLGRKSEYDTGWIQLFGASARERYGLADDIYKVDNRSMAKVVADNYVSAAFTHASKGIDKARRELSK